MAITNEDIFSKLDSLESKLDAVKLSLEQLNQPVIRSAKKAAKYIGIGHVKFAYLVKIGKIISYSDIGGKYYLKSELLHGLEKEIFRIEYRGKN